MTVSAVSICNRALHKLGTGTITDLTDNSEKARVMNVAYEPVRDAELRRHRWRFAIKRTSLAALADTPDSDYEYQYQVPGDFLRLIEGGDIVSLADLSDYRSLSSAAYSLEGRTILTDLGAPLAIRYIARIEDTTLYDSCFVESLAARLAFETVERITESSQKKSDLMVDYRESIKEAIRANALERAAEGIADDTWVLARIS